MFVVTFLLLFLWTEFCLGGDPYYTAEWSDVIRSCPDFDNIYFSCENLELGSSSADDDDDGGLSMRGDLVFLEEMKDGISMELQVFKSTELGDEPVYSAKGDFCSSLKNSDTPWYSLVSTFNSSSCPIPKNQYSLDGIKISIDFAKDVMSHEFCGEYMARMVMVDKADVLSCHMLSMAVVEKYDDE